MAQMKYKDGVTWKPLAPSYKQHTDATTRITTLEAITNDAKVSAIKEKTFDSLDARLEESEQDLATHEEQINEVVSEMADIATQDIKNEASNIITPSLTTNYLKRIESYDNIISMPNNANGQVYLSISGMSLNNILPYNHDTWVEWSGTGLTKDNSGITLTNNGISPSTAIINVTWKINTKYLLLFNVSLFNSSKTWNARIDSLYPVISIGVIGNYKGIITTGTSIINNNFRFASNDATAVGSIKFAPNIRIFELPTGSQIETDANTLTADQLAVKYPYVKGGEARNTLTQSRLVSRGKNLLKYNGSLPYNAYGVTYSYENNVYSVKGTSTAYPFKSICKIPTNSLKDGMYKISKYQINGLSKIGIRIMDRTVNPVVVIATQLYAFTILGGHNELNIEIASTINDIYDESFMIQLEKDSVATFPYEPYKESTLYTPNVGVLRSLPNLVADKEFEDVDGKWKKVQNVSGEYVLQANDITAVVAQTNNQRVAITLPVDVAQIYSACIVDGYPEYKTYPYDVASAIGCFYNALGTPSRTIYILKELNTYPTLADARKDKSLGGLVGTIINYQLATPIITELQTVGQLEVYPSGSITVEPTPWGYATGAVSTVTTADLPIKSIRKVEMSELSVTGKLIKTDITANCTFSDTTLTIGSYDVSKVYFYDCEIDSQYGTNGYKTFDVEVDNGIVTHDYLASVADWVLTSNEAKATMLTCNNAGGSAKIIAPAKDGKMYIVKNDSGQTVTVKTATSTGVTIPNGFVETVSYTGSDYVKVVKDTQKIISDVEVNKFPATNIIVNSDFTNAAGWVGNASTITALNNILTATIVTLNSASGTYGSFINFVSGHKYYIKGDFYLKYANRVAIGYGGILSTIDNTIANAWNKISTIITATINESRAFVFYVNTLTNYIIGDTIQYKKVISIDLTSTFGIGNEPTATEMDTILAKFPNGWFDGTVEQLLSLKEIFNFMLKQIRAL